MKHKTILKTFFIDLIFLCVLFYFIKFMFDKIKNYALLLTSLNLGEIEDIQNIDVLQGNIEILNAVSSKILLLLILTLVVVFLLYSLFQSLNWNLVLNKKFKNYKKYFLKFLLVNIPIWIVSLFVIFKILFHARGLIITSWVKETYLANMAGGSLPALIFYVIMLLAMGYFAVMLYVHLNKDKIIKSIELSLKEFLNYKLILKYLGLWVIFILLIYTAKIHVILWVILVLIQIQFCRIILSKVRE